MQTGLLRDSQRQQAALAVGSAKDEVEVKSMTLSELEQKMGRELRC